MGGGEVGEEVGLLVEGGGQRALPKLGLTQQWEAALDARLALCPTSPVRILNDLLRARAAVPR
ncbi:hypothetical protein B6E66_07655 [Streptomyces maremycinicus]|nr:hypothetical protein B6E66_07655 [Streptomyces sp. B9173]